MMIKFIKANDVRINMKKVSFYEPFDGPHNFSVQFYTGRTWAEKNIYATVYFETQTQRDNFIGTLDLELDIFEAMGAISVGE